LHVFHARTAERGCGRTCGDARDAERYRRVSNDAAGAGSGSTRRISTTAARPMLAVVNHYNMKLSLGLTAAQKADLVEYLKSL
jgi:hypothetical protein